MKKIIKTRKRKKLYFIAVFLFLLLISFLFLSPVEASLAQKAGDWVTQLFGWIFAAIVYILGLFLMLLVRVLIYIASIQSFINVSAVILGWQMVRDLANMFFVIILLIIAFATILRIEKYNYKKWLPKLILMAVLINYSRTICGLLIDFSQIIMLSFVNSFKAIGGTNVAVMLGIQNWQNIGQGGESVTNWEIMASYFLAVVYVIVSIVVIGTMILVLVMRIVMIWIYIVLSPFAFLMSSFPGGQGYAAKWWTQFTQNLVVGPVLAFFIWLSFSIVTTTTQGTDIFGDNAAPFEPPEPGHQAEGEFGQGDLLIQFIVSIGLLIGGLKVSQEIGGAAGSMAGKGMARLNKMSLAAQSGLKRGLVGAGKSTAKFAGRQVLGGASLAAQSLGQKTGWKGLEKTGNIGQAWREDIRTSRKKNKVDKREKFLKNIGMGEKSGDTISSQLKEGGLDKRYETMYKATEKMGRGPKQIREWEKSLEEPKNIQEFEGSDVYTKASGLKKGNTKTLLNNEKMLNNLENWLSKSGDFSENEKYSALAYTGDKKDLSKAKALEKALNEAEEQKIDGIDNEKVKSLRGQLKNMKLDEAVPEVSEKKSDATSSEMKEVKGFLRDLVSEIKGVDTKSEAKDGGIRYDRSTTIQANKDLSENVESAKTNQGKLFTNSFASGDKDVMGIDFNQIKSEGIDIDTNARGANLSSERMGDNLKPIIDALISQLSQAQINLDERKKLGKISESEYEKEMQNISGTKDRLRSGDFQNINLVNTGKEGFNREMALRTNYHEELHAAGLEDEYLTKTIEDSLMNNKLYGRNPETGNRHVTEIAKLAQDLKTSGASDQDVIKTVEQEISNRNKMEAGSRAQRVIKLEKGQLETESQASVSIKKEKKKDSIVDLARERSLIKKQESYYRKMISEGSKKDERGSYNENKVKIGEEGIKKIEELTRSLNRLDSLKQDQDMAKRKINTYRENIKGAEKNNKEELVIRNESNLRKAEKEQIKINQEINTVSKEISNKKEDIEKNVKLNVDKKKSKEGSTGAYSKDSPDKKKAEIDYKMNVDYDSSQLEGILKDFSSKLEKDLSDLEKSGNKSPIIDKEGSKSEKIDLTNFLNSINKKMSSGNESFIKLVDNYNKSNQIVKKNIILNEIKDQLDD